MKAPVKTVTDRLHSASWHQPIPCEAKTKSVNSQEEPAASIIRAVLRAESKAFQTCLQGIVKKKQERRADFPTAFIIHPCTLTRVFTMLGEISVCSLWMHIRNLCTAVCRLRMAVQRLQTETSANCLNTCSTLRGQSQHAANGTAPHCGKRPGLMERKNNYDERIWEGAFGLSAKPKQAKNKSDDCRLL